MKKVKILLLLGALCIAQTAISQSFLNPPQLEDGLKTQSSADAGMNTSLLTQMAHKIDSGHYVNIHSVLIMKDGKLVYEKYGGGFTRDQTHTIRSISKFVTSTLVGIAIDKGHINSIDDSIFDYLPNYANLKTPEKEAIKIKHLPSMSAGFEWREADVAYGTDLNDETKMYRDGEWVRYTLSKPMIAKPGEKWEYSGGLANLMAAILQEATGMPGDEYVAKHLFGPLGIDDFRWSKNRDYGWVSAAAGVHITPRSLAKIGQMYLDKGMWNGKRILSENWVNQTGSNQIPESEKIQLGPFYLGYGYTTLVIEKGPSMMPGLKGYVATGNGGQILWMLPEENTVIIMTGGNFNNELSQTQPMDMAIRYIYPAIKQ